MKKKEGFKCVVCGQWKLGWGDNKQYGNNPYPLADKGQCCDDCNKVVIELRIDEYKRRTEKNAKATNV